MFYNIYSIKHILPKIVFSSFLTISHFYLHQNLNAATDPNYLVNNNNSNSTSSEDTMNTRCLDFFKNNLPLDFSSVVLDNPGRSVATLLFLILGWASSYDSQHKNPKWVMQYFTLKKLNQDRFTTKGSFKNDPRLPSAFQLPQKAFSGTGYDRGHMVPASDMKQISSDAYSSSYLFTNISPQNGEFNKGYWKKVEQFTRNLLNKKFNAVFVVSGPMYLPVIRDDGRKFVTYEVLESNISVPTHYFKLILAEKISKNLESNFYYAAFVFPNKNIGKDIDLEDFLVPIEFITSSTGLLFFPSLIKDNGSFDKSVRPLCDKIKCSINLLDKII